MKRIILIMFISLAFISGFGCSNSIEKKPVLLDDEMKAPIKSAPAEVGLEEYAPTTAPQGTLGWYVMRRPNHETPTIDRNIGFNLSDYKAYYIGSQNQTIFLTFDEGYEKGYTASILDTLKAHQVPAAFFVTEPYIRENPDLIKRMVAEGHLVVNHSKTHPSMPSITGNQEKFNRELLDTAQTFKDLTGQDMPLFFRPPKGEYNQTSLQMTADLGYKTIFWSFAYEDWLVDRQPDPEKSLDLILKNIHPGEIMLLHAVSKTNSDILGRVITGAQAEGYRFATLHELAPVK
ncbi:MAG TPA: hypothetical protein DER60_14340 [Syntrophomonas sp.]|jgi:peptidoglycan-N-acetylmuramic acid deacetylase|nr:hypothetical protein [Syntrophomonas sp.]